MEKDANYALVGLISLLLLVGLMSFGIWLSQFNLNRDYQNYDIIFQRLSVHGSAGSSGCRR